MKILKFIISGCLLFVFTNLKIQAQVNDAGLWTGINLEKKISKRFSVTLSEELRMNENISEAGSFLTDVGLNYKVNKYIRISGSYRFTNKRQLDDSYSERHRYYFDLNLRTKYSFFTFNLRSRYQSQYKDINSSAGGKIPDHYLRNKLSIKYELNKKIDFFISNEFYTPLRTYDKLLYDNIRYNFGVEYTFNKMHSIDLSYLIQREYNVKNPETDYVICIGYNFNF